jgi:hypothetical protein
MWVTNLNELSNLLASDYPGLYEAFTLDVVRAMQQLQEQVTVQTEPRLRWWMPNQLVGAVRDSGFAEVEAVGYDRDFVVHGRTG